MMKDDILKDDIAKVFEDSTILIVKQMAM